MFTLEVLKTVLNSLLQLQPKPQLVIYSAYSNPFPFLIITHLIAGALTFPGYVYFKHISMNIEGSLGAIVFGSIFRKCSSPVCRVHYGARLRTYVGALRCGKGSVYLQLGLLLRACAL